MTSFDSSRVVSAFDGLVDLVRSLEPPPLGAFTVSENLLPALESSLQLYADQLSRTKKDVASLRSAWNCLTSVAPFIPSDTVTKSCDRVMLPSSSDSAPEAVTDRRDASPHSFELQTSRELVIQLQKRTKFELEDLAAQHSAPNDFRSENEKLRAQISELEAQGQAQLIRSSSNSIFAKCSEAIVSGGNRLRR
jgi:hypothetical protein